MRFWLGFSIAVLIVSIICCLPAESVTSRNVAAGGLATNASLYGPTGLAVDESHLYIVETNGKRVRRVDLKTGFITTIAGGGKQCLKEEDAQPNPGCLVYPQRVAVDSLGDVYVTDANIPGVIKVGTDAHSFSMLTSGNSALSPDSPHPKTIELEWPAGIAIDPSGGLFFDDHTAHTVYRLALHDGSLRVLAGTGREGFKGDGGPGTDAEFRFPEGLVRDKNGNIFIADYGNCRIQRIDSKSGIVTTLIGTEDGGTTCERLPDYGATKDQPTDVGVDQSGNIFFVQPWRERVRRLDAKTGIVTTVAGSGESGFSGDGRAATSARFHVPEGVAVDKAGNLYISDFKNNRVRRVDIKSGIISTVAGKGPASPDLIM
jgi:sugar lactone lactonase YvrE